VIAGWDPAAAGVLTLPSGRLVRGRALIRPVPAGPSPDFGLYLLGREPPTVTWEARWLRWPARVYTDIFRGLPEVVIILLIGLGIGPIVGGLTNNNPYPLGIAALGLTAAAYVGEIFRSGIQSVEPGQLDASRALGLSYNTAMRMVVIPQGIRRVLPALVNQFIALLKASALVYFLGLIAGQRELFQVGRDLNAQTGSLSPLVAAGVFYLILTIPLTHLVNLVDNRLRHGRAAAGEPEDPLALASSQEML